MMLEKKRENGRQGFARQIFMYLFEQTSDEIPDPKEQQEADCVRTDLKKFVHCADQIECRSTSTSPFFETQYA